MPCIVLAFVIVDLTAATSYIAVLNEATIRERAVHIIELVVVHFNARSFINMDARFGICYVAIVNCYIGTVVEHNTKTRGIINFAIGNVNIVAVVKRNAVGASVDRETANGNIAFTVIRNWRMRCVSSCQRMTGKRTAH